MFEKNLMFAIEYSGVALNIIIRSSIHVHPTEFTCCPSVNRLPCQLNRYFMNISRADGVGELNTLKLSNKISWFEHAG